MKSLASIAFLLVVSTASGAAFAQTAATAPLKPISIRLGIVTPTDRSTRELLGKYKGHIGASFAFTSLARGGQILPRLDFDYWNGSRRGRFLTGQTDRLNSAALTINALVPLCRRDGLNRGPYVGLGVGLARVRHRGIDFGAPPMGGPSVRDPKDSNKTGFAAKAFVGYNFTRNFFGEVGYSRLPRTYSYNASNSSIQIGARF